MAVITTVAGDDANSYLSVAEADTQAASELGKLPKEWLSATTELKEAALIRASAEIDEYVGSALIPWAVGQALRFPRWDDVDVDGVPLIPKRVGRATFLQAAYMLANAEILDAADAFRARGLTSFSNPDGTGGQLSDDASFGRLHGDVKRILGDVTGGVVIGTIVTR
jgi:hypothetical protein